MRTPYEIGIQVVKWLNSLSTPNRHSIIFFVTLHSIVPSTPPTAEMTRRSWQGPRPQAQPNILVELSLVIIFEIGEPEMDPCCNLGRTQLEFRRLHLQLRLKQQQFRLVTVTGTGRKKSCVRLCR